MQSFFHKQLSLIIHVMCVNAKVFLGLMVFAQFEAITFHPNPVTVSNFSFQVFLNFTYTNLCRYHFFPLGTSQPFHQGYSKKIQQYVQHVYLSRFFSTRYKSIMPCALVLFWPTQRMLVASGLLLVECMFVTRGYKFYDIVLSNFDSHLNNKFHVYFYFF